MAETVTITITKSIGYSGKNSGKSYLAKIGGTDLKYIFSREFVGTDCTDKVEMFTARRKRKGTWTEAAALEPGLYERSSLGERSYLIVWMQDGVAKWGNVDEDRALRISILRDEGQTYEESRKATKPPAKSQPVPAK